MRHILSVVSKDRKEGTFSRQVIHPVRVFGLPILPLSGLEAAASDALDFEFAVFVGWRVPHGSWDGPLLDVGL